MVGFVNKIEVGDAIEHIFESPMQSTEFLHQIWFMGKIL